MDVGDFAGIERIGTDGGNRTGQGQIDEAVTVRQRISSNLGN